MPYTMILEYLQAALGAARYEMIDDPEPFYGEIPVCRGVWATGRTLKECRRHLTEALEGWIVVRLRRGLSIPPIKGRTVKPLERMKVVG